jgi:hypothetical protein
MPGKRFNDPSIPEITRLDVTPETVIPVEGSLLKKTARLRLTNLAFQSDLVDAVKSHEAAASHALASTQKNGMMSASDKLKLDAVQLGATANSSDVHLLERGNHTGEQSWVTITDTPTTLSGYGIIDAAPLINGQIPTSFLPSQALIDMVMVNTQAEMLALTGLNVGDRAYRSDLTENRLFTLITLPATNLNNWQRDSIGIQTVNGQSGPTIVLDAADVGADSSGTASSILGSHTARHGNGAHLPEAGITNANVAEDATIAWGKISKSGATPGDIGAQPSGSYAPNPVLNTHISPDAAIAWGKISKVGATPGDIGAQPSGNYAPNPVLNTHISPDAAIAWGKISKVGATPADIGAQPSGNYAPNPVLNAHIGANAAIDANKITIAATGNLTGRDLQSAVSYLEIRSRTHLWANVTNTPTTLSGYGITDAAPLVNGQIPTSFLPSQALIDIVTVNSQAEMLAITGFGVGDRAYRADLSENRLFTLIALPATNLNNWQRDSIGIQTVNGQSGPTIVLGAANVGADPAGTADAAVANHASQRGNGTHIPTGGIANANVASNAAIAWDKISKVGATPADIGAQPSGSYATNPVLNTHISPDAAIAWGKISKVGATPADIGAQPSGSYAPNPVLNAHIAANAAIDATKIVVASTGNLTARDLQSAVSFLETRTRTHSWANVTNTPTTLSGYGITDAAPLVNGQIPTSFLPSQALIDIVTVNSQAEMLAITGFGVGDRAYRADLTENRLFTLIALPATNLNNWQRDSIGIQTVNGQSGPTIVLGAANVGADPVGTADAAVANHASQRGNGTHIPTAGITDTHVAGNAAIAWAKISKSGATPADIGAQPSGNYAPNPVLNTHIAESAAIAWGKISKSGATPADIGAQPSGSYAPNPVLNTHIAESAAIAWGKISKVGATPADIGAQPSGSYAPNPVLNAHIGANAAIDASKIIVAATGNLTGRDLQSAVSYLEIRSRTHSWANVTNTPTTLSGYGITDAAPLVNGQIPTSFLPTQSLIDIVTVNSQAEMLAITGFGVGDRAYRADLTENRLFTLIALPATNINNWQRDSIGIQTVNGQSGPTIVLGAANVGADPVGTADAAVANHASQRGNGTHIPTGGIANANVASSAAIAWDKISKVGATPGDIGAQPSGSYAPNPVLNTHIAPEAAIAATKIAVATAGNLTGRDLQAAVTYLEARTRVQENIAMNGDFLVAQRGTSFSVPSGMQSFYTLDRWAVSFSGTATATVTQSLSNTPTVDQAGGLHPGASFQLVVNTAQASYAADQWAGLFHRVEGILLRRFFTLIPYTVSFWVKSSRPGTYCLATRTGTFSHSCVVEYTINAANTWERKVLNFPALPSGNWNYSNGTGVEFFWTLACGSNFRSPTPGAWSNVSVIGTANQVNFNETSGNTFALSLVKVEPGTTPTLFVPSPQSELDCKRYYTRVALSAMGYTPQALGFVGSLVALPVPMRLSPSAKVVGALSRSNISTNPTYPPAVGMGSTREGYFIAYSEIAGHCWVLNELWEFNAEL